MIECPKCGSFQIRGPFYTKEQGNKCCPEYLSYMCGKCGYEEKRPCKDAEGKENKKGRMVAKQGR